MNKRRLLKLAALLEADAKNKKGIKFNMYSWGFVDNPQEPISCGTTACAAGLAAISGAFKRQGLGYEIDESNGRARIQITLHGKCRDDGQHNGSFISAKNFFALSASEAEFLFVPAFFSDLPPGAKGERIVAKRIRDLVAGKIIR